MARLDCVPAPAYTARETEGNFMRRSIGFIMMMASALVAAMPAQAEIFQMDGHFPAPHHGVSLLRSIGVDRIAGRDGTALALAIEQKLSRAGPDGRPYYAVIALSRRGPDADGIVTGLADASVRDSNVKRQVEVCAEGTEKKCTRKEKVEALCLQQSVTFAPTLRIARAQDGQILYNQTRTQTDIIVTCPNDKSSRSPRQSIDRMVRTAADQLAADIVPRHENYRIRLREGREGMDKPTGKAFRDSIISSQRDPVAACGQWATMDQALPGHPSLLFNLGLCAERDGDYAGAERFYAQAGGAKDDVKRVRDLTVGRADAAERARGL
jgi:hypothetical protein